MQDKDGYTHKLVALYEGDAHFRSRGDYEGKRCCQVDIRPSYIDGWQSGSAIVEGMKHTSCFLAVALEEL